MKALIITTFFSLFLTALSAQRPGDLDADFADNGVYLADWQDTTSYAYDIDMMPDGDLLISGMYRTNSIDMEEILAMKLDPAGNRAPFSNSAFGFGYNIGSSTDIAFAATVLPDGNIILSGLYLNVMPDVYPFALRLSPDGQLDEGFGESGVFAEDTIMMSYLNMELLQVGDEYLIFLCGETVELTPRPIMIMINSEGEKLPGGFITTNHGRFVDMAVDNVNMDMYIAANLYEGGALLLKMNLPGGTPDTDFGDDGILSFTSAEGFEGTIKSLVLDMSDTTLTAFGDYPHPAGDQDIFAYRVNAVNGVADSTFGVAGFSSLRIPEKYEAIFSAILQSDGKYYFGGSSNYLDESDFFLGRINHNGIGDTSFGTNGLQLTPRGSKEGIKSLALNEAEDMLYAAGASGENDSEYKIMVAAYHTVEGAEQPPVNTVENHNNLMHLFPNPSSGSVTVETGTTGPQQLQVFDLTGNTLINKNFLGESCELNLEMLQPSVYFVRVTLPDGQVSTSKLIVQ